MPPVETLAMNGLMCWRGKGPMTPFGRQRNPQNYHLASVSPYTVRDLRAGGMHIGILIQTAAKQSNGSHHLQKKSPSNFYGRVGKSSKAVQFGTKCQMWRFLFLKRIKLNPTKIPYNNNFISGAQIP